MANAVPLAIQGVRMTNEVTIPDVAFQFSRLPTPIPASLRPLRRVALLLLLVAKCHGSGASWKALQLLNWVVRDTRHATLLVTLWETGDIPDRPVVRFDPALERAIDLAIGLNLVEVTSTRAIRLTTDGGAALRGIANTPAFENERATLSAIPGKVTRADVERAFEWRRI